MGWHKKWFIWLSVSHFCFLSQHEMRYLKTFYLPRQRNLVQTWIYYFTWNGVFLHKLMQQLRFALVRWAMGQWVSNALALLNLKLAWIFDKHARDLVEIDSQTNLRGRNSQMSQVMFVNVSINKLEVLLFTVYATDNQRTLAALSCAKVMTCRWQHLSSHR